MMPKLNKLKCLSALDLKILAMVLMLCDHAWATVIPGNEWLTSIGRLAFPIFAFQIAEGYCQTHNFKKYLGRMFFWALVSEIPFNLMMAGGLVDPFEQNVLFTFCEALLFIRLLDWAKQKNIWIFAVMIPAAALLGYFVGMFTLVDYFGSGVLMVLLFYLTHGVRFGWIIQLAGMFYINCVLMGGMTFEIGPFAFPQQGLALLALIPIWLYNGKQGPHSPAIRRACYAFYPLHILILSLIAMLR